ncbi:MULTISPECIES: hypothetical protein [Chloroflexus]|nr:MULTISPECIES: hypothetical protein [Chloroflexus]
MTRQPAITLMLPLNDARLDTSATVGRRMRGTYDADNNPPAPRRWHTR